MILKVINKVTDELTDNNSKRVPPLPDSELQKQIKKETEFKCNYVDYDKVSGRVSEMRFVAIGIK